MRCGCGAVAFIFSIYFKPVLYYLLCLSAEFYSIDDSEKMHFIVFPYLKLSKTNKSFVDIFMYDLIYQKQNEFWNYITYVVFILNILYLNMKTEVKLKKNWRLQYVYVHLFFLYIYILIRSEASDNKCSSSQNYCLFHKYVDDFLW